MDRVVGHLVAADRTRPRLAGRSGRRRVSTRAAAMTRRLIVNADDFGRTAEINAGVIKAFEDGIVTSATLMVRYLDSAAAAGYAADHPALSLGLHLDLGEWQYVEDEWRLRYQVVDTDDAAA